MPTWNTGHPVTLRIVTYQDEPNTNRRTAVPCCSRERTFFARMISCFAPSIGCLFQFAKRSMLTNSHLVVAALLQVSLLGPASAGDKKPDECGLASVYATVTEETASGEDTQPENFTAAHRTLPFGTLVDVDNQENGHWAVVRITDRGPFVSGRIIDLSQAAARALGISGLTQVCLNITRMPERQSVGRTVERPPARSSDSCSENLPYSGGESHRQGAPECHSGRGAQNIRATRFCPDCT